MGQLKPLERKVNIMEWTSEERLEAIASIIKGKKVLWSPDIIDIAFLIGGHTEFLNNNSHFGKLLKDPTPSEFYGQELDPDAR